MNTLAIARIFRQLMQDRLGYGKFLAQGGDWGSAVVGTLGRAWPDALLGVHLNMGGSSIHYSTWWNLIRSVLGSYRPALFFSHPHYANFSLRRVFVQYLRETGYFHIQSTKPDTVGVALNDSPLGLLAYIGEKFSTWTDPAFVKERDGGLEK